MNKNKDNYKRNKMIDFKYQLYIKQDVKMLL